MSGEDEAPIRKRDVLEMLKQAGLTQDYNTVKNLTVDQMTLRWLKTRAEKLIEQEREANRRKSEERGYLGT